MAQLFDFGRTDSLCEARLTNRYNYVFGLVGLLNHNDYIWASGRVRSSCIRNYPVYRCLDLHDCTWSE